jgi:CheY-like chemotaxis protein/predicted regulator of Ras-like GTPase activity (Roadblock/LC7/MglB family)
MNHKPVVLIVDDEELFLRTVSDGFMDESSRLEVLTAKNGAIAVEVLRQRPVDLVVTDLKMPEMDGFALLAHMSQHHHGIPAIVMTAFGTPEVEARLLKHGVSGVLDKPLDFQRLHGAIMDALSALASGHLKGISLSSFLQMIQADQKTVVIQVGHNNDKGYLHFLGGNLVHAEAGDLSGDKAAIHIFGWEDPIITMKTGRVVQGREPMTNLTGLLMESFRLKDEAQVGPMQPAALRDDELDDLMMEIDSPPTSPSPPSSPTPKERHMAVIDKLKEFSQIEGFAGCGLFTPAGEQLAVLGAEGVNLKEVGVLANNVLMNAQRASLDMGTGLGQQVHIEAQHAHILVRCLNEGTDPLKSQPGKAHIHLVLILKNDASIGMAKLKINSIIAKLAEDFRV